MNDPDTDNDGMSDGWEVQHGLNPLDNGESEDLEVDPTQNQDSATLKSRTKPNPGPTPAKDQTATPTGTALPTKPSKNSVQTPNFADTDNDGPNDR